MKKYILLTLIILWLIIIFAFSNRNALQSLSDSNFIVDMIIVFLEKIFDKNININNIGYIVRKCAHFFEYFILGILVILYLNTFNIDIKKQICISILFCIFYSLTDEIHQLFIPGRNGNLIDVFVDTLGCILGVSIMKRVRKF